MLFRAPHSVDRFRGLWDRGDPESVPRGYLSESFNLVHSDNSVSSRPGSRKTGFSALGTVTRTFLHRPLAGTGHLLVMDNTGALFDTSVSDAPPIYSLPDADDFVARSLHGRTYLSFLKQGRGFAGNPGGLVHVYDGDPLLGLRLAAGAKPIGPALSVTRSGIGRIEAGLRKWCVAYRTRSGHVTVPSLFATTNLAAASSVTVSRIPIGGNEISARLLFATKRILDPNHRDEHFPYYLVKAIEDNVTTDLIGVSFYESELLSEATRYFEQLESVPGGTVMTTYAGRLVVGGSAANPNRAWISDAGYPERFDSVSGLLDVRPDEGEELVCAAEYRDRLYFGKRRSFLFTQQTGTDPVSWPVLAADHGVGSTVHGVAATLDRQGGTLDRLLVISEKGLLAFDGTFHSNLAFPIESLWGRLDRARLHEAQALIDPVQERIYCLLPIVPETVSVTDAYAAWEIRGHAWGSGNSIWGYDLSNRHLRNEALVLVADYREGLSPMEVRWSVWTFPEAVTAILVRAEDADRERLTVAQGMSLAEIRPDAENDDGHRVEASFLSAFLQRGRTTLQCNELMPRVLGDATHALILDGGFGGRVEIKQLPQTGRFTRRVQANYAGERIRFGIKSVSAEGGWELRAIHAQVASDGDGMPSE